MNFIIIMSFVFVVFGTIIGIIDLIEQKKRNKKISDQNE